MAELHDLLERATDAIEPRGGAAEALRTARRRRTRRRGTVAVLASAAAVVAVVVGVRVATGGTGESSPPPAESPSVTPTITSSPSVIPADLVQAVWDPRGAEGLPVTELGVPRVMPSSPAGSIDRPPVAILDDGSRVLAVAADGDAVEVAMPEGVGRDRTVSLSPDGTRVAVVGPGWSFWRDVNSPTWRRIHVELVPGGLGDEVEVHWAGRSTVVLRGVERAARIDLDSGDVMTPPDGVSFGVPVPAWLSRPVSQGTSIAAVWSGRPSDGVVVVDPTTWEPRVLLPVQVAADRLTPVGWIDATTVAFRVTPPGSPKEYLITWDVESGELSRISCWLASFHASFATDLLG